MVSVCVWLERVKLGTEHASLKCPNAGAQQEGGVANCFDLRSADEQVKDSVA